MPTNTTSKALPSPATTSHQDSPSPRTVFYGDNTAAVCFCNERLIAQRYSPCEDLEVSLTNIRMLCPFHNVTTEWLKLTATECEAAVSLADECAGVVYFNTAKEVKSFTIVSRACEQNNQAKWLIGQQGNHLYKGQVAVKIRIAVVYGSVLVPMRKPHAIALKLPYDTKLIVDKENTNFWVDCGELNAAFPGNGALCMAAFPYTFALGYGSVVPSTFNGLVATFESRDPADSITAGEPMPRVTATIQALARNNFCTFFAKTTHAERPSENSAKFS